MNWNHILTIYLKELKDAVRDRRTMISVIGIPTIVMPLLFFGMGRVMTRVFAQAEAEIPAIVFVGGDDSPAIVAALKEARSANGSRPLARIVTAADFKQAVINKQIAVAVEIPAGFDAALQAGEPRTVGLNYFEGDLKSDVAARALERFFSDYRQKLVEKRLGDRGLPASLIKPYEIKRQNVAPQKQVDGNRFGGLIPYLIIILCFTGAMYPAMDTTAGEKERGTMETLLCSPLPRLNIVLGKLLLVLTGSLTAIVCTLTSMTFVALSAGTLMGGGKAAAGAKAAASVNLIPAIDPYGLIGILAMIFPMALLFASIALTVSLFAKSFKEAQSYLSPMIFVVIMPAMIGMLPGVELSAKTALIPILNLSLVCKEMLSGVWHWNYIGLIFGSTALYAAVAVMLCVRMFNREDVIFRA